MSYFMTYWCNLNLRDKYFDGYNPDDDLVYVGEVQATGPEDAYEKFNRIDQPVPVLDEAEAPSMSVGDVIHMYPLSSPDGGSWLMVARLGFEPIKPPDPERLIKGAIAGEVIRARYPER